MKTNYAGIDYSAGKPVNRNLETGIRLGVIHQNKLEEFAFEEIFNNGTDLDFEEFQAQVKKDLRSALQDYFPKSKLESSVESAFDAISDDLQYENTGDCTRYRYEKDGLKFTVASDGDIFVMESPFFTYAQFCSPCAPGACYLASPLESPVEANKCYCLGTDWFDEHSPCPYPVYSTKTGERI